MPSGNYLILDGAAHWQPVNQQGLNVIRDDVDCLLPRCSGIIGIKRNGDGTDAGGESIIMQYSWAGFFSSGGNKRWSDIIVEKRFRSGGSQALYDLLHLEYIGSDLLKLKIRPLAPGDAAYNNLVGTQQADADALVMSTYEFFYKAGEGDNAIYNSTHGVVLATACFTGDALVKTDQGLLKIKDVTTNHTIDNKEIKGVSKTIYPQDKLVAIEKNAFGENKPNEKILVAPFHRFSIDGNLKTAVELVNNDSVYVTKYKQETLYNVILETQETMEVNNIVAETLDPNTLVAKLFDGSMENKQRNKVKKSLNAYHKNLKNKPNKKLKDYRV